VERTVKQVAARVGLPERTVRYYDRIALVSPPTRSSAGYRLYSPQDEGRLRFVRQAKSLGFSLEDIRALMAAAERGRCGEVGPELDRLLDEKVAQIDEQLGELAAFRERLLTFRAARGPGCGCRGHGAFCGCLGGAPPPGDEQPTFERRSAVSGNEEAGPGEACSCGKDGGSCNCAAGCGCGTSSANGTADIAIDRQPVDR
jgi:DNA-binding transcriptional MerR regulator